MTTNPPMPFPIAAGPVFLPAFLLGLVVGSFLNVCIHRIPLERSVVWPGSACPACGAPIAWYDNVPVLSWVRLDGRCRSCRAAIPLHYPLIELLTGGLAVLTVGRFGVTQWALVAFAFQCALVVVSAVDVRRKVIPDVISLPGVLAGLGASTWVPGGIGLWDAALGALLGGGLLWVVASAYWWLAGIEGLGLGDAKLLAMIGAVLGWQGLPALLVIASVVGSTWGIASMLTPRARARARRVRDRLGRRAMVCHLRRRYLPFGPFLSLGAVAVLYIPALSLPFTIVSSR